MNTQKDKIIVCTLHSVYTRDIIAVSLSRKEDGFAVLKRKNNDWYITILRYKERRWFKKIIEKTTFDNPLRYISGYFINSKWQFISRKSFSCFQKIDYLDAVGTGYLPEKYLI